MRTSAYSKDAEGVNNNGAAKLFYRTESSLHMDLLLTEDELYEYIVLYWSGNEIANWWLLKINGYRWR